MLSFLARRFDQAIIFMLAMTAIAFVVLRYLTDPMVAILAWIRPKRSGELCVRNRASTGACSCNSLPISATFFMVIAAR